MFFLKILKAHPWSWTFDFERSLTIKFATKLGKVFEKILIDGAELPAEKTKDYESEFEDSVVLDSLENII